MCISSGGGGSVAPAPVAPVSKVGKYDPSTAPKRKPKGKKVFTTSGKSNLGIQSGSEKSGLNIPT